MFLITENIMKRPVFFVPVSSVLLIDS